jgi:hypothetical protein
MKRILTLLVALLVSGAALQAQIRYAEEVFSDADIVDTMNVAYGANFNPYINPAMVGGQTQVQPLQCDVYLPSPLVDTVSKRPVIIYIHTGSFLPQSITNSCTGSKEDSAAVRICRKFARHGFVTISASYRLGWLANSIDLDLRRGTNLLAVYYSIQDIKTLVRFLNVTSALGNPLQIDTDNIILLGQGSGGYTSLAYASLDEYDEVTAPAKFQYQGNVGLFGQPVNPGDAYVDTAIIGDWDGFGGAATIIGQNPLGLPIIDTSQPGRNIENHVGASDDVLMVANMGGALGDSSWIDAGEVPIVSLHCRYDFFAPYYQGMVQVPVGLQFYPVVYVQGSHWAVSRANALGNNDIFLNAGYTDPLWTKGINNQYNTGNAPGIYTFNNPPDDPMIPWEVNSGPWDYWDNDSSNTCVNPGNPNDYTQSKAYIDTVVEYLLPRFLTALANNGVPIGVEETRVNNEITLFPNPASGSVTVRVDAANAVIENVEIIDITGKTVATAEAHGLSEKRIDINALSKGIYLVRTTTNQGVSLNKLNVQ